MQSLSSSREMASGERSPPTTFNVVIVYEDFATRKQARKGLDYVAEEFGNDFGLRHSMWRLDILQNPKLSARAAPSLAESDLLMISLCGERPLPAKIRALIDERLVQTVNHECALVELFEDAASATHSSVNACLATRARQHGLDFFEQAISEAEDQKEPSLKLVLRPVKRSTSGGER
jgi:hypothetical protein